MMVEDVVVDGSVHGAVGGDVGDNNFGENYSRASFPPPSPLFPPQPAKNLLLGPILERGAKNCSSIILPPP